MYTEYPVCTLGGMSSKHTGNEPDFLPVCTLDRPISTLNIQCEQCIFSTHTVYPVCSLAYPVCTLGENKCPVTSFVGRMQLHGRMRMQHAAAQHSMQHSVLATRTVNPETSEFSSAGTCKKYRRTIDSGTASNRKIMKNMTYRVLDPGFTMHA